MQLFTREELRNKAMTVKTFDNELFVNLYDGTFIKKKGREPLFSIVKASKVYEKARTVRINERVVAKRKRETGILEAKIKNIKRIDY